MAWRDNLLPASFRGVQFRVSAHEADAAGRRIQTHEYPGRDEPYTEDLGRRARAFEIEAYIVGDDYMARRDALLEACDRAGPGELVHPYLGRRQVACERCRISERLSEGRMCRATLRFVEAGRNRFPASAAAPGAALSSAADAARAAAATQFEDAVKTDDVPSFVAAAQADAVRAAADEIDTPAARTLSGLAASLARDPAALAARLQSAIAEVEDDRLATLAASSLGLPAVPETTASRRIQAGNQAALIGLVRDLSAVRLAERAGGRTFLDRAAALSVRDSVGAALDDRSEAADTGMFRALRTLRAAVTDRAAEAVAGLPVVIEATPGAVGPSLALAYDLYDDIDRAAEIAARNNLPRPGFVPSRPIELLSA